MSAHPDPVRVLISSAGRRNELVSYFQALPLVAEVHTTDLDPYAPAAETADRFHPTGRFSDPDYGTRLIEICRANRIDLVLTLNDFELPILARLRPDLAAVGTTAVVSDPEVIDTCLDKKRSSDFLQANGFDVPRCFDPHELAQTNYPVIVKPRFGTGSIAVEVARDQEDLAIVLAYCRRQLGRSAIPRNFPQGNELLVEQQVSGIEYAIDVINDLEGRFQGAVIKRKLAKRGDAALVVTEHSTRLLAWAKRLGEALGHRGNLDCDVFANEDSIYCVDLNPRFGGAYPFSHLAGVNLPERIVRWSRGEVVSDPIDYQAGVIVARTEAYLRLRKQARS